MGLSGAVTIITLLTSIVTGVNAANMNVLFLAVDDLRPEINAYKGPDFPDVVHPNIHTPNLDLLFKKSLVLKRAYVQQAICSPSRTSLLTGRRPDTTHVYDLDTYFRTSGGNFTTIPQYFKENGFESIGMGKIFHPGRKASGGDDPISWSVPYFHASKYWQNDNVTWRALDDATRAQHPLPDDVIAQRAVETLRNLSHSNSLNSKTVKPFFLAVGFHKPHLPFIFPEKFLQYYPTNEIRLPENQYAPVNMPYIAWSDYGELLRYGDIAKLNASGQPNTTLPTEVVKYLRRAYYCAVSYIDDLVGTVIAELERSGLANNTIILFWGDHGWQLGEHGEWTKHTNFELATHAPMSLRIPGLTDRGIVTEQLTEFVDLFPTLAEAAGLPKVPLCPRNSTNIKVCTEGDSLMPLIRNPNSTTWKQRVFSQYPRHCPKSVNPPNHSSYPPPNHPFSCMGYSMRTSRYRYTEWVKLKGETKYTPNWRHVYGIELYDHVSDPQENVNIYAHPAYKTIVQGLSEMLHKGWRK